jgi:pyruvate dehydrogenase E2 component (dihydrolipoamide acetyltransferase)
VADDRLISDSFAKVAFELRRDQTLRSAQIEMAEQLFPDGVQSFDLRAALGRVAMPMRIVWGKSDKVLPWRQALEAPGTAALHLFDGIGHMPHLEVSEQVGRLIRDAV